jgi:hypothetical protein
MGHSEATTAVVKDVVRRVRSVERCIVNRSAGVGGRVVGGGMPSDERWT